MRKNELVQIRELVQTLNEVNDEFYKQQNIDGLIDDTIEFVAGINHYISGILNEENHISEVLLDYSSLLNNMKLSSSESKLIDKLNQKLIELEKKVNNLSVDKIEILFLSYKVSMKDSLESIWEEAIKDSSCDVYIMPIPYFDFLPDGQLGDMNIEVEGYDSELPIVDWRTYDIENRRPDVIFTNNAYDEFNVVTSVHPDFYCKRLRELTECLCYIPYFLAGASKIDHFAKLVGVVYADKVILESESIREVYIDVYVNELGGKLENAKEKFVALGSPKMDKIMNGQRDEWVLPIAWKKLIKKDDRTNKKIILYNTSIAAALADKTVYLKKISYVLKTFKERDDVVLWLRPHPLLEETFARMIPEMLDDYRMIVANYINEGYGIYDDSSDLQRSIHLSDAYYGDGSSLTTLYALTKKPIVYQTMATLSKSFYYFYTGIQVNNVLYSSLVNYNALCMVNLEDGTLDILSKGGEEDYSKVLQHSIQIRVDNDIFLIPVRSTELIKYNIENNTSKVYSLKNDYDYNFRFSFKYGHKIYLTPFDYPAIAVFDYELDEIHYCDIPYDNVKGFRSISSCLANDTIILVCENPNAIIIFDCNTEEFVFYNDMANYRSVCYDGNAIWLGNNEKLVNWYKEKGEVTVFEIPKIYSGKSFDTISFMVTIGTYIILFPVKGNILLRLNVNTETIDVLTMPLNEEVEIDNKEMPSYFSYLHHNDEYIFVLDRKGKFIAKIQVEKNIHELIELKSVEGINFDNPFGSYDDYRNYEFKNDLGYDIDYLINNIPYKFDEEIVVYNNGKNIYEYFKNLYLGDD